MHWTDSMPLGVSLAGAGPWTRLCDPTINCDTPGWRRPPTHNCVSHPSLKSVTPLACAGGTADRPQHPVRDLDSDPAAGGAGGLPQVRQEEHAPDAVHQAGGGGGRGGAEAGGREEETGSDDNDGKQAHATVLMLV